MSVSSLCFVVLAVRMAVFHNACGKRRYIVTPLLCQCGDIK